MEVVVVKVGLAILFGTLVVAVASYVPAQTCAGLGKLCATLTNQSNPPCCGGLSCNPDAHCVAVASTTTTSTTVVNGSTTTTTTLPPMSGPVVVTAQDVSLKVHGGADYSVFRGHAANQYERDMMEQTLLGVWTPQVIRYMEQIPACSGSLGEALSNLSTITQRLDVVHQYDDILGPPAKTWQVTAGGRHYQIEYYINQHAHDCSLNDPTGCAVLMTPDLADLLDLSVADGQCVDGASFEPLPRPEQTTGTLDGIADGRQFFPVTDPDDLALLDSAVAAHLGGECGQTPNGSVSQEQLAFEAAVSTPAERHYRSPQPFLGGCDPGWTSDECCGWKALEHREYMAWANAVVGGNWGLVRCFAGRHRRMHMCANLQAKFTIRMPPCTVPATYPDATPPVTCSDYLANPVP